MKEYKLTLTIIERFVLSTILPQKGNMLDMKVTRDISEKISTSQLEIEKYGVKSEATPSGIQIRVNEDGKLFKKTIILSEAEKEVLQKQAKELETKKEITIQNMDVIDQINNIKEHEYQLPEIEEPSKED